MLWYQLADQWGLVGGTWATIDNLIADPGGEIFVRLSGTGSFMGSASNVAGYSYSEGSTPLVPGDESGAIGDMSIDVMNCNNASILLYKDEFYLQDNLHGAVLGEIENVSGSNNLITMGGRSRLALLNVDRIIPPRSGTIGAVMNAVFGDVGITSAIILDTALSPTVINAPGYEGDVWVYVKDLCSAYEVEVTVIREYIIVRPARQRVIDSTNILERNWQVQDIQLAQQFDVAYYNYEPESNFLVFPKGGWTPEVQVYQVEANETITFEIPIEFFLTSINQPTVQDNVAKEYAGPSSVYSASGNDNLPVTANFWNDFGGDMSFAIKGPGNIVEVTLTGPDFPELSPYSISVSDGSTSYSTLRITGTGMNYYRELYTEKTGLSADEAPLLKGQEIDNSAISTLAQAKRYALFARRLYSLPRQTYSTSARTFDRLSGSVPTIFFPTFDEFSDGLPAGYTFTSFNNQYSGVTFQDFTVELGNAVPQGFGEVSGSKIKLEDAMYRVRSVNITPDVVSIEAEYDTLFSDLNPIYGAALWEDLPPDWDGLEDSWSDVIIFDYPQRTFTEFNTVFSGVNFKDFALLPLRLETCQV